MPLLVLIPDFLLPDPKLDNIEEIKKVHVPVILLHGDLDTTAPPEHAKLIFANANEPKKLVCLPHSSHNDISQDAELFATSLKDFFNKTTVPADWTPTPSERVEHKEKLK